MELPRETQQFVLRYFDSVAELEGLLLMRRESETSWTTEALSRRLYISEIACDTVFKSLHQRGFLSRTETPEGLKFRYQPDTPELSGSVETLAELHTQFLIPITNLLHEKPRSAIQGFADAFRFKERK